MAPGPGPDRTATFVAHTRPTATATRGKPPEAPVTIDLATAPSVPFAGSPRWTRRYASLLLGADLAMALAASGVALFIRFGDGATSTYLLITALFPLGWVLVMAAVRAYELRFLGLGAEEFKRVFDGAVRYAALVAMVSYAFRLELARGYVLVALPMALALTLAGRYAARRLLHGMRRRGRCQHRVLVVGRERSVSELLVHLHRERHAGLHVVGACLDRAAAGSDVDGVPVVGSSATVLAAARGTAADTVAVTAYSDLSQSDLRRLSWQLEGTGIDVLVAPNLTDVAGPRIHIRPVAGLPLLHVDEPEFTGGRRLLKAVLDRVVAGLALIVAAPVLAVAFVAVRCTSRGPGLFRQARVGRRGQQFTMLKLRTMRVTAEEELAALIANNEAADGLLFKIRQDPRVTRVGAILRRYSLDELPQLWNVLRGQMSLVGPRPPLPHEVAQYPDDVRRRLLVKPGLTGLWQISGRSNLSWDESVRLDLHYVESWTLALDAMIIWKTFFAVLARRGAY